MLYLSLCLISFIVCLLIKNQKVGISAYIVSFLLINIFVDVLPKQDPNQIQLVKLTAFETFKKICSEDGLLAETRVNLAVGSKFGDCDVFKSVDNYIAFLKSIEDCKKDTGFFSRTTKRCDWRERVSPN